MNLFLFVKGLESKEHLLDDIGDDGFRNLLGVMVDEIGEGSCIHELYEHEEWLPEIVGEIVIYQIFLTAHPHDCDLDLDLIQDFLISYLYDSAGIISPVI